ncbi:glycosyltransferase family 4 protein [filamentous cyanobacterium LEGE 11480]|uniref:Glycosyltransferase family 4 protein n=1 Tax=Romeriopsis navalis LEGE 11480 TaxID=2777977 RepID=A0A928VSN2_9CYAN|nr:glycosyltransferase family 1 protein [Romeriopsis navalis]MBE9032276.1 glycosyltransferase family 4 protein [Romeriopsis navalis LEGE 11480]
MLRITIDTSPILPRPSGIGFYVVKLLEELTRLLLEEASIELELMYQISLKSALRGNFSAPPVLQNYQNLRYFPLPVKITNLFVQHPQLFLPLFESACGFGDIFHGTNYTVFPLRQSRKVMTIYDLTFIKYPHYSNAVVQAYADRVRRCLRWTDLVLTISESSKRDIVEYLGFPAAKVIVTPLASRYSVADAHRSPNAPTIAGYDAQKPYILFVSTIEPRKNILGVIAAFDQLKKTQHIPHDLVLVGQKGWLFEPIFERIGQSPYCESIHHLDYLTNDQVSDFYRYADVFVYPSHYEGFGLPVLEAMTLGCPVVCSNNSSLPEVAGPAAVLVDADDAMQIAQGLAQVIGDRELRDQLIQQGFAQAQKFTWRATAERTLQAYKSLA